MISYDEALARLIGAVQSLPNETIGLDAAEGRTLAKRVVAAIDAPRADVSAMDGYAVRMAEAGAGDWLNLVGEAAAGAPFGGTCLRAKPCVYLPEPMCPQVPTAS